MPGPIDDQLARVVVERGLLTPAQVDAARAEQGRSHPTPPLEVVLVEQGLLAHAQVEALLRDEARACDRADPRHSARLRAWRAASQALARGAVGAVQVNRALREEARRRAVGEAPTALGAILVEQGALTEAQAAELLRAAAAEIPVFGRSTLGAEPGPHTGPVPSPRPAPAQDTPVRPSLAAGADSGSTGTSGPASGTAAPPIQRFGKYEILWQLGRGGMGVVYRAFDTELHREVALKTLHLGDEANPEMIERLLREARTAATLHHPGIVPIHDAGTVDGIPYFAMEYVRGRTLHELLATGALPGVRERASLVHAAAQAVAHAHAQRIIHRDLKPANLLVDDAGRVHVLDFGLAKRLDQRTALTASGQMLGTPQYMPPEQINGELDRLSPASDVYSLGAVLYEALAGRPPFEGATLVEIVGQALAHDPVPPRRLDRRVPRDLETVCLKALAKEPERRYPTAGEFAQDLGRYLSGEAIEAHQETWLGKGVRWARRRKGAAVLAVVAALSLGVAGALAWTADAARAEQRRLATEVVRALSEIGATYVDSALMVRRAGGRMTEVEARFLAPFERAARRAASQAPHLPEPHYYLGRMYRALLRFDDALREQDRALAKDASYAPSLYERALVRARKYAERAAQLRERWLRTEGQRLLAEGRLAQGDSAGAGGTVRALPPDEELAAGDATARALRAGIVDDLARLERTLAAAPPPERAGRAADRVAEVPITADLLACARGLERAYAGATAAAHAEARALLAQALAGAPTLEEAYEGLAKLEREAGDPEKAIAVYGRGLAMDKGYVPFYVERGDAAVTLGFHDASCGRDPAERYRQAEADFTSALDLDPLAAAVRVKRGMAAMNSGVHLMNRGDDPSAAYARAEADLTRALELDAGAAEGWVRRGMVRANQALFRSGRGEVAEDLYRGAEADFAAAIERAPTLAEAWMWRGAVRVNWAYDRRGRGADPEELNAGADSDYTRALALDPRAALTWIWRGAARVNWADARQERGGNPRDLFARAEADYAQALALDPRPALTWLRRGMLRTHWALFVAARGEDAGPLYQQADQDFGKAIERNPAWAEARMRRADASANRALDRQGRGEDAEDLYARAEADYGKALELNPTLAEAWTGRGQTRLNRGNQRIRSGAAPDELFGAAEADLAKALELNARSADTWTRMGSLRLNWGTYAQNRGQDPAAYYGKAEADYARALELNPRSPEAWLKRGILRANWAICKRGLKEDPGPLYAGAEADLGQALALNPGLAEARINRGLARMCQALDAEADGKDAGPGFAAALADLDAAVGLNPKSAEARWRRGKLCYAMKRWAAAVVDFEAAQALNPGSASLYGGLLERARRNAAGVTTPAWVTALERAGQALQSGDYAAAGRDYEAGLAGYAQALAALPEAERARLGAEPAIRDALVNAHYNLACVLALQSAGKAGPQAAAQPLAAEAAAALRDQAFTHVRAALDLGWSDPRHLGADADLAPLHDDSRWAALLESIRGR